MSLGVEHRALLDFVFFVSFYFTFFFKKMNRCFAYIYDLEVREGIRFPGPGVIMNSCELPYGAEN